MAPSTSTPTSGGKAMSSRLLTMKFMQRAAASSPTTSSPTTPDEPSAKRRKVTDESPSRSSIDALADQRAVQAAVAEEEAKRQAALERQGAEAGDTRWVLNFEDGRNSLESSTTGLRIVQAGYANLDRSLPLDMKSVGSEDVFLDKPIVGRKSFGKFNRVLEKQQNSSQDDSSDSGSDSGNAESEDEPEGSDEEDLSEASIKASQLEASQRAKAERKAKKKAEKAESLELAQKRKKKDVKLNNLMSLTGRQDKVDMRTCHKCGGAGHLQKDCSKPKRVHQGGDDGPPRKSRRSR